MMRFLVLLLFVASCALAAPQGEQHARILSQNFDLSPDGNFKYNYETENRISADVVGTPKLLSSNPLEEAEVIQGRYSWVSPEGKTISVTYIADEAGYRPQVQII